MGISPGKSTSSAEKAASGKVAFQKILYRGWFFVALLAWVASRPVAGAAQEERPQITPGERKAPRKKDAGPRAVGVLQLAANGKATLVPVAILIGGKFWDATAYKADPIPMALEPGTVYEAERAGSSLGLFTVNSALHSNTVNAQNPWIGTGLWLPAGTEQPKTAFAAESVPVGIDTSDAPPRLTRSPAKEGAPGSAPASNTAPPSTAPAPTGPSASGEEPPRLKKSSAEPSSAPTTGSAPAGQSQPAPSSPAPGAPNDAKPAARPAPPTSDSGADEANRPKLRRGKPVDPLPDDDVPGYGRPGAVASRASAGKMVEAAAGKPAIPVNPAISDASGPEPRSFAFEWLKDEEGERRQQVIALAKEQVREYVDARSKAKITPKPASPLTARQAAAARAKDPILENVQMIAYDLWTNNQPIIVFSAEAHMPPPAGSSHPAVDSDLTYPILLVTHPDIYNNLHKLYVGVTDKNHLDVTPRLELVDAVDADGDGRGELLFRETSDSGSGWVIYRATVDKLWKLFDSLNPQ
jgi:hypothetical protein